jgi:DNA polymerase family A
MILFEFDLAGAEWVVVAYLCQDENMLGVVRSGKSPHVVTGSLISGATEDFVLRENELVGNNTDATTIQLLRGKLQVPPGIFLPRVMSIRQAGKKSNHGLNYNMKFRRFALENEMLEEDARPIVEAYSTKAYPRIQNYWADIRRELKDNKRQLVNCFGRKVHLRDEWGETLFNQAYSFKPQSTVVDIVNRAMRLAFKDNTTAFSKMFLGAQVHDSLQIQSPVPGDIDDWYLLAEMVFLLKQEYMRPELEYNGTKFRLECDVKMGLNWGDMHKVKVPDIEDGATILKRAYGALLEEAAKVSDGQLEKEAVPAGEVVYLKGDRKAPVQQTEEVAARDRVG